MIRVRFAPSPTGYLHVGAARTALFNWLYARRQEGRFILRIEDTDAQRSTEEMSREILEGLRWLGMDWDEGPIFQSSRLSLYRSKAEELLKKGLAYHCYCGAGETSGGGEYPAESGKQSPRHCCASLSAEERARLESLGRPRALRFYVPDGEVRYTDLVHGPTAVQNETMEDFVLLRSDGQPTYHLSVVVDDIDLNISHIIRGDDHISNTPKQILLYQAFGVRPPKFAHLALILGPDRKKLSKRHGVTSVLQFRDQGFLSLALVNFLAQLGWSPGEERRLFSPQELIKRFSLKKLSKGSPLFDMEKLEWLNGLQISEMPAEDLYEPVRTEMEKAGLWQAANPDKEWFLRLIDLIKGRNRTIEDFVVRLRPFLLDDFDYDPDGVAKHLTHEGLEESLARLAEDFLSLDDFAAGPIETALRRRADKDGLKAALLIHALRMLTLGKTVSPGIFDVLELLGRDRVVERMKRISRFSPRRR
jgi:glutamyl-tRNA synthetase